ncbi:Ras and Rab interactor 3 [Acipenser ruthenus]|uniref:Ras and Rab interactor 3 n=1 Tax=Acipenser ruthenus TaxID=7906 RepID=A0A444V7E7_ACIRT|nr:Ras and Rab interactor 3 [Acipenser ruthenus]
MRGQGPAELGVALAALPDSVAMEKIRLLFQAMHDAYSPGKQVKLLLRVCKCIYQSMNKADEDRPLGADDFLPVLTYTLLHSDTSNLQLDVEYMMELLEPSQLQGEGGYYLTTLFGGLFHIRSYQPRMVTRQISVEAQKSISQWQRRRTINNSQGWRRVTQVRHTH